MDDTKIGIEEWRAELERQQADDPGLTIREICEASGQSRWAVTKQVAAGVAEGRYRKGVGWRVAVNGRRQSVTVYEIVKQTKKK